MAPPPRLPVPTQKLPMQRPSAAYSLELLTEYAHTLDAMPLDLSRIFADLRELDAVLTSTVASLTTKIYKLIEMIENRSASNEQRLWLLGEIAEEAHKVRPGADDKIRIATQAADALLVQKHHLTNLATHLPEFEPAMLVPKTRYPHVSHRAYMPTHTYETGRRRRAQQAAGTAWMGAIEPSPHKKRRVVQDEDLDYGTTSKSPRKEKTGDAGGQSKPRGPRTKKVERHPSPPESVHSLASHAPAPASGAANTNQRASGNSGHRNNNTSGKRRANAHANNSNANGHARVSLLETLLSHPPSADTFDDGKRDKDYWPESSRDHQAANGSKARGSTQSSLTPQTNTNAVLPSGIEGSPAPGAGDASTTGAGAGSAGDLGADGEISADIDGEADDGKIYCFCNNGSFGEMIGCDEPNCKREWFHLSCVGLREAPKGVWYCDECAVARKAPRNPRKKRAGGGGRPNGKNAS